MFGWLSDKIGRKPILMAGFALAVLTYFPIFQGITHYANPKLEHAPASADPADINYPMTVLLLAILVLYVTMVYGPIAAWLVELFPTRIRYTGLSLPYHIGNGWFGGFLPATVFAIVAATGNIYSGLWYPIAVAAMSFVVALFFLPETRDRDITAL